MCRSFTPKTLVCATPVNPSAKQIEQALAESLLDFIIRCD